MVLVKTAGRRFELIDGLAGCLKDKWQAGKVEHSLNGLLAPLVFSIAGGYADANDSARLATGPVDKMLMGHDPVTGLGLASQLTPSNFENAVLQRKAEERVLVAGMLAEVTGKTEHIYSETSYAAGTWPRERCMIRRPEVVRADGKVSKDNPCFGIRNMQQSPQWIYEEVYWQRGDIEDRIKELHALDIDISCSSF